MECNREEAVRALDIAETKLQKHDLEGARRLVQKAQRLFPSLSRIPQMSALLNVFSAAASRGTGCIEPDWYAVLGFLDSSAPLAVIKKKYHAMALLLHPDKNASRYANEGFKLVAQAWSVLSSASTRSAYDSRRAASHGYTTCRPQDGCSEASRPPAEVNGGGVIVFATTLCPHCKKVLEVLEMLMGNFLQCKYCEKVFLAVEHSLDENISMGEKSDEPLTQDKKDRCSNRNENVNGEGGILKQNVGQVNDSDDNKENKRTTKRIRGDNGHTEVKEDSGPCHRNGGRLLRKNFKKERGRDSNEKLKANVEKKDVGKEDGEPKETAAQAGRERGDNDAHQEIVKKYRTSIKMRHNYDSRNEKAPQGTVPMKNVKTTRARKLNGDERPEKTTGSTLSADETEANFDEQCRSSIKRTVSMGKKKVDMERPCKRSPRNAASANGRRVFLDIEDEVEGENEAHTKPFDDGQHAVYATPDRGTGPSDESCSRSQANNIPTRKRTRERERIDYSDSRPRKRPHDRTKNENVSVPDADFCSFSDEVSVDKFEEGQVWALYDDDDQMPRFYGYIKRIFSKDPFKVKIQWLEAKTDESRAIANWIDAGFYLGCGEFKLGDYKILHGIESFSHQIFYWENTMDGNFRVMPGKGEVWALYKEWNASWNGSESLETLHAYEIVKIATEFDADAGFEVIPVTKLKNYVSVFRREKRTMVVPVHEKLRFSHSVPFKELSGDEDRRLPISCLQLDTAALKNENS
ncbi:unnamed protein product [Victoria cruziana]